MTFFADRFLELAHERSPLCVGVDPSRELFDEWGLNHDADGLRRFCNVLMEAAADHVGVFKVQSGFFERFGAIATCLDGEAPPHLPVATAVHLERRLEDGGFDTTTTWDSSEAIALLRSRPFNALLVGAHPPEKCQEILKTLRPRRSLPCIVLQTPTNHPLEDQHLSSLGASAVVPKQRIEQVMEKLHESVKNSHGPADGVL